MYRFLYRIAMAAYGAGIALAAPFHARAHQWRLGRKNLWPRLREARQNLKGPVLWFHAASLGEAEQVVPVIELMRERYPGHSVLLSFFSPSGYEHFRQRHLAEAVVYLPLDHPVAARKWMALFQPRLAFFVKYDIWPFYLEALRQKRIPTVLAPAYFRPGQFYFRWPHRSYFLPLLRGLSLILTQNETSAQWLQRWGLQNARAVGDSRFDRVLQNVQQPVDQPALEDFASRGQVMVAGSTWPEDERLLVELLVAEPDLKMIIAPHDIGPQHLAQLEQNMAKFGVQRLSEDQSFTARVVLVDSIGLLSRLYRLGTLAYIGGAFGEGIHNSLEAVAYGCPVFFGPRHKNFIEPSEMLALGFAHEVKSGRELILAVRALLSDPERLRKESVQARDFVQQRAGVAQRITEAVRALI